MNLSYDAITAYGALSPESCDTLNVQWVLTQACTSQCSYCVQWGEEENTVYDKERVLEIAYKILEDRRPHYSFTFTGGEPTLHPHLTDVLEYLYRSRISLDVTVETNGLRSLEYYRELVSLAQNDSLQLTISAHLHKITLENLCSLVTLVAENKQHAHVRLVFDPEQRETMSLFHAALVQLRAGVPFTLAIWPLMRAENPLEIDPRYTQAELDWCIGAQEAFEAAEAESTELAPKPLPRAVPQFQYQAEAGEAAEAAEERCCVQNSMDLKPELRGFFCCAGTNFLRINADGTFQGALCRQGREQQPLWKEESHISQAAQLLVCSSSHCVEACNAVLPKFRTINDAVACLHGYAERTRSRLWEKNSAPHPFHPAPTTEDVVRNRLKRLEPLRIIVDRIDPVTTAIITFGEVLEEAISHYSKQDMPQLPIFVLADWNGGNQPAWQAIAQKYSVRILPMTQRQEANAKQFCLYARPLVNFWEQGGYQPLAFLCAWFGLTSHLLVDAAVMPSTLWRRDPNWSYIPKRWNDICSVYTSLADEESRDVFLRAMKCIATGDSGYLKVSPYAQYAHPLVKAERGDILFEGGLCTGHTTKEFSKLVGSEGAVYGFEPLSAFANASKQLTADCTNVCIETLGLWSEKNTFYIEDNGGGSRMVSTPTERSEECHAITLDSYIADKREICTLIKLDIEGAEVECLKGAAHNIDYHRPKLQLSLYHHPDHYLDIPLLLRKNYPEYTLYMGHHSVWYNETCLYALPPVLPKRYPAFPAELADKLPLVSVIVPTHNNEDTLKRCLDSALIQGVERMELIVIDDASTDKTPEIIAEYARRYPKIVRSMRFAENRGAGPARNMGMDMACGQYTTFIDSDDMLAEDFLSRGLEVMAAEDADIVAFDMVMNWNDEEVLWGVEPGSWSGEDSLRQLLLEKAGCYGTYCRLYRTHMLRRYAVCYSDTVVHEDMFFSVKAFYYSRKTVVLPEVGYYRYARRGSLTGVNHGDKRVIAFIAFVGFLTRFFAAHGLSTDAEMYRYCIKKVYGWNRNAIFDSILDADKQGRLGELLTEERLLELGSSKEALCCLLADYALLHCHRKDLHPTVAPKDLDWEAAAAVPRPPKTYTAYGNADTPDSPAPILSVIVPNYNKEKYLAKCLDSILCQTMQDFELIIIDDASTDGSWDMLRDYADQNPCIRLYRMEYNNRQGVCRNIGIEKARGDYVTFIDSDDYPLQHFFALGVEEIVENQCDAVVFSTQILFENGACREWHSTPKHIRGAQAFRQYLKGGFAPAPHGKMFSNDFIITNNICFPDYIYHQDQMFIAEVFWKSNSILCVDTVVYTNVQSSDSSIRPATRRYLHLHSAYTFYAYFQQAGTRLYSYDAAVAQCGNHITWNIENVLLAACAAFLKATGAIPMTKADHTLLQPCSLFFRALLLGYARCRATGSIPDGVLPQPPQRLYADYTPLPAVRPLISVIIPTCNQEAYIERCLKGVLTQSLRSLEVLVVNDASTDKTLELCLAWQAKDARVRVFSNEQHRGQGYSCNKALEEAQGKYITYVDSDVYMLPNFLLRGVRILENAVDIDIVHDNFIRANDAFELIKTENDTEGLYNGNELCMHYCKEKITARAAWGNIYRKQYLLSNDIQFSEKAQLFEDSIFVMKAYKKAQQVLFEKEYGYLSIQHAHPDSAEKDSQLLPRQLESIFAFAREVHTFCASSFSQEEARELSSAKCARSMWQLQQSLPGIVRFIYTPISPLTDQNMQDLAAAPEFLRRILNDYARLYALYTNDAATLPPEDLDPQYQRPEPADYLVPVSFHPERQEPVLLSVIIPAYRVAPYLARCLDSVLTQNVDGVEILLVEDCTKDDETLAICEQYARNYPEIRFFRTPWNSGLGTVRNLAMQQAQGIYLTFVDSDDWMAPDFLRRGLPLLQKNPHYELADFSYYDWDDTVNKQITFHRMPHGLVVDKTKATVLYIQNTYKNHGVWAKIYRTDFLRTKNIVCGNKFNEDESFLLSCYSAVTQALFYDITAYYYVRNADNVTIMRPSCRGKQYFESTLENLRIAHTILGKDTSVQGQKKYKKRIQLYTGGHHRDAILHYIHACNVHNLPSPLTDEVLETLTLSKEYLRNLVMDYAVLSQTPPPQK